MKRRYFPALDFVDLGPGDGALLAGALDQDHHLLLRLERDDRPAEHASVLEAHLVVAAAARVGCGLGRAVGSSGGEGKDS
ncbi:MAG: hypothetical protein QM820_40330 [Minicystis sp.]